MDVIDHLRNLPIELKKIVLSFYGNPHGFTELSGDHACLKYHIHEIMFHNRPDLGYKRVQGGLVATDRLSNAEDEFGNSRVRLLFLKQWANPAEKRVCGLKKRPMRLVTDALCYATAYHDEIIVKPNKRFHLNTFSDSHQGYLHMTFESMDD